MSKIIEHTSNGFKWLLVECPIHFKPLVIDKAGLYAPSIVCEDSENEKKKLAWIKLPSPPWEIVGKADSLTEEQWEEIVELLESDEHEWQMFKDYEDKWLNGYNTTTESGLSLLRSHGLKPEATLILKSTQLLKYLKR